MGKMNKNPGKRWQELLGLTAVPYFGQDTIPYNDDEGQEFIFDYDASDENMRKWLAGVLGV